METTSRLRSIHIPLADLATVSLGVYVTPGEQSLDAREIREKACQWAARNLDRQVHDDVAECLHEGGLLDIRVVRKKACKKPDTVLTLPQKEAYRRATHVVLLESMDLPYRHCRPYLRALVAATCGVAEEHRGLIVNRQTEQVVALECVSSLAGSPSTALVPLLGVESTWEPSGMRIATLGMDAFALPDVEVREVPSETVDVMTCAVNTVAQWLLNWLPSPPGSLPARLSIPPELVLAAVPRGRNSHDMAVVDTAEQVELPLPAGQGAVRLRFGHDCSRGRGFVRLIPPRAVRLVHPHRPSATWMREFRGLVSQSLCLVPEHSELMEVAHRRAISRIGEIQERFERGLPRGESLFVKKGFGAPGQGLEFMWVEVETWTGGRIRGVLANEPVLCPGLRLGQWVDLEEKDVFDWALHMADGSVAGNLTTRAARMQSPSPQTEPVCTGVDA